MEFHGKFHGVPWKIQWNSIEFHGLPWKNIMKKIRQMFMENPMELDFPWKFPWNSMENSMN
jgi:hypothetical protein